MEFFLETMLGYFDQVTGDRAKSERFLPIVGTLFLFILFSNWIGLMPGTGSIGLWQMHQGELELIPLLRPANADLNMTLAMAVLAVVFSHVVGIITIGFFKHANKFIQLGTLWKSFRKGGINILTGIIDLGVGLLEIISEIAKDMDLHETDVRTRLTKVDDESAELKADLKNLDEITSKIAKNMGLHENDLKTRLTASCNDIKNLVMSG